MLLSRESILAADDRGTEDVDVPEWGGTVRVRALSGTERDAFEASIVKLRGDGTKQITLDNARARLVALAACDENGAPLFELKDVTELGKKSATALTRVYDVAARLSGLTDTDVKELTEDFGDAPSGDSTSD